jgi:lipoprotein NlpD
LGAIRGVAAPYRALRTVIVVLWVSMLLAACASTPERTGTYTVKRGDTLFSIGTRLGYSYKDLARWNGIGKGYVIYPGQVLKLYPRSAARGKKAGGARASASSAAARAGSAGATAGRGAPRVAARPLGPPVKWQWPVSGGAATLTARPNGGHGLTINGRLGDEIRAAGPGKVVYTGAGLLGYGQLVIIKHNDTYLSAYGHTRSVEIREGEAVVSGQRIATMGAGPQGAPMLYFEIRVHGEPHNPLSLLPQR